jgi:hypothetical protein
MKRLRFVAVATSFLTHVGYYLLPRRDIQYDCMMAEQAFLNWQFGIEDAFPASSLAREYGAFFPRENEKGLLKVVHEKM